MVNLYKKVLPSYAAQTSFIDKLLKSGIFYKDGGRDILARSKYRLRNGVDVNYLYNHIWKPNTTTFIMYTDAQTEENEDILRIVKENKIEYKGQISEDEVIMLGNIVAPSGKEIPTVFERNQYYSGRGINHLKLLFGGGVFSQWQCSDVDEAWEAYQRLKNNQYKGMEYIINEIKRH